MFVANETPSPSFSDGAWCGYTDAGVAIQYMTVIPITYPDRISQAGLGLVKCGMETRQQRGGIRGIPYLQQKCSQHHIDIRSPGSWGMMSGLEMVGLKSFGNEEMIIPLLSKEWLITLLRGHGEHWSIIWLLPYLWRMPNPSAQFQTDNKPCAGRGTGGGTGGIGKCP